jgi:hypothetical protein
VAGSFSFGLLPSIACTSGLSDHVERSSPHGGCCSLATAALTATATTRPPATRHSVTEQSRDGGLGAGIARRVVFLGGGEPGLDGPAIKPPAIHHCHAALALSLPVRQVRPHALRRKGVVMAFSIAGKRAKAGLGRRGASCVEKVTRMVPSAKEASASSSLSCALNTERASRTCRGRGCEAV